MYNVHVHVHCTQNIHVVSVLIRQVYMYVAEVHVYMCIIPVCTSTCIYIHYMWCLTSMIKYSAKGITRDIRAVLWGGWSSPVFHCQRDTSHHTSHITHHTLHHIIQHNRASQHRISQHTCTYMYIIHVLAIALHAHIHSILTTYLHGTFSK